MIERKFQIEDAWIYAAITISSVLYSIYLVTDKFIFRAPALGFVILFYVLCFLYTMERRSLFTNQFRKTKKKWLFLYILIVCIPLFYSVRASGKDLLTLFFHPLAFLAFFIAFVALTVNDRSVELLQRFSRIVNNLIPLAIVTDLVVFHAPAIINDLNFFLLIEVLFIETMNSKRKLFIGSCIIAIVIIEVLYGNRMIALRQIAVAGITIAFILIPFLKIKVLRFTALLAGISVLYLLSFHFEATFQFIANSVPDAKIDTTDTRSFLYDEFFQTFKGIDWLGGRGYMGTYFSPWFYEWQGDDGDYFQRFSLEVGVLEILLKGGLLLLIPFYLIFIKALYKGFVLSSIKSVHFKFSIFLFVQFMITGVESYPFFNVNYMLIWLAIGIVFISEPGKELVQKPVVL